MDYQEFHEIAGQFGYETRKCSDNHWQVKGHGVTVNVWPKEQHGRIANAADRFKFLRQGSRAGQRAETGTLSQVFGVIRQIEKRAGNANGAPKPATSIEAPPPRDRLVIEHYGNCFLVVSHGDAIDELTFDEMLGVVVNLFHTPKLSRQVEDLFAAEKLSRVRVSTVEGASNV